VSEDGNRGQGRLGAIRGEQSGDNGEKGESKRDTRRERREMGGGKWAAGNGQDGW